ncbi:MAG: glycosyltransferase family 4 protein [Candidatus Magasanikbacteria bacterium]|nr:glycosyltransferase family 4 protein [Candidatus Magasanikbacteria bacterium]
MILGIDASRANTKQRTGVEQYAFNIIQGLKKVLPSDVEVILYSQTALEGELAELPSHWRSKVLSWPPRRLWTQIRLGVEMLFHKPDILFIPAHVPPLLHPRKTVMMIHDVAAFRFPETYNIFERWYSLWSARYALKRLWRIIVPSEFTGKELCALTKPSLRKAVIAVIHHGFDMRYNIDERNPSTVDVFSKYGLRKPYILSIGRLEEKKNTLRVIQAFNAIKKTVEKKLSESQLVLVGKPGHGYESVKRAIDSSPYKADIIELGWVSEQELPYILKEAVVFLFPSLHEGFGLPVLEAFASGTPAIVSKDSASAEIASSAALSVDPLNVEDISDALILLLKDFERREQYKKRGFQRLQDFSWGKAARKTADLLLDR